MSISLSLTVFSSINFFLLTWQLDCALMAEISIDELVQTKDLKPRTWEELKLLVSSQRMELIGRTAENYAALKIRMSEASAATSIAEFIRARFLQPKDLEDEFAFCPNEFPYWIDEDIFHYVLWYAGEGKPSDATIIAFLDRKVGLVFPDSNVEYIWANHKPQFHSVKDVFHVQVFIHAKK